MTGVIACPFGEPITECPFIPYYRLNDELKQIGQIEVLLQEELDKLRTFHRSCMERYRKGEWKPKKISMQVRDNG